MIPELGAAALVCAFATALFVVGAAIAAARGGDRRLVDSARRGVLAMAALLTVAVVCLEVSFLRDDFSVELVADHSSTTTPTGYKMTAMWSSQAGSLLLWAWVLSLATSGVLQATRNRLRDLVPWATAILGGLAVFFIGLMLSGILSPAADSFPFTRLDPAPAEGVGLTPLLRHPAMAIHPPMLYSGYVLFSIPFAFAIAALITRRLDAEWIRSTRRFALVAWLFLGTGVLLGSFWSYNELGWGGYWGWDPVENASLMPWLLGTAFLHSVIVQEKRGILRAWNVSLVVATFAFCLLGTFLVRSGILQSIHAFGVSKVGGPLLALIALVVIGSAALVVSRLDDLRSERRIESLASREAVFLVNNLLLVALCAVIFWGTFFPLISEALTGQERSVGAPFFNAVTTPLAILLVLFTGIGPLLAWRRVSAGRAWRLVWPPALLAGVVGVGLVVFTDAAQEPAALVLFCFASFTLGALAGELLRASAAQRRLGGGSLAGAAARVVARNRRRYGGYLVHAGIAILFVAVAASSSFQTSSDVRLQPGQSATVGDFEVSYVEATSGVDEAEQRLTFGATLDVRRDGEEFAVLSPSRNYYSSAATGGVRGFFEGEATSEVGRRGSAGGDFWTAMRPDLAAFDQEITTADRRIAQVTERIDSSAPDPAAAAQLKANLEGIAIKRLTDEYVRRGAPVDFRVNYNPLVMWLWIGGAIGIAGGLIAIWPAAAAKRRRVADVHAARLARDLGRA
ncbi:MAG: heme lyase CcmF/NrfE family subunit [Solirubrobacterales bacterium]